MLTDDGPGPGNSLEPAEAQPRDASGYALLSQRSLLACASFPAFGDTTVCCPKAHRPSGDTGQPFPGRHRADHGTR